MFVIIIIIIIIINILHVTDLEHKVQSEGLEAGEQRRHLQLLTVGVQQPEVLYPVRLPG